MSFSRTPLQMAGDFFKEYALYFVFVILLAVIIGVLALGGTTAWGVLMLPVMALAIHEWTRLLGRQAQLPAGAHVHATHPDTVPHVRPVLLITPYSTVTDLQPVYRAHLPRGVQEHVQPVRPVRHHRPPLHRTPTYVLRPVHN